MRKVSDLIHIIGHKNPDTDSIVSAIAYAELKRKLGVNAVSRRLGEISAETKYILERFNVAKPKLMMNAFATLQDIEMDKPISVDQSITIFEAMRIMEVKGQQVLAVENKIGKFIGIITKNDISNFAMIDTNRTVTMLKKTSVNNISDVIGGDVVYHPKEFRFNGRVSLVSLNATRLNFYDLEDTLVILGNDETAQLEAIEKGAACLVLVWVDSVSDKVIEEAENHECALIISSTGSLNTARYILLSATIEEFITTELVSFHKLDKVEDVSKKMLETRFRTYPVLDNEGGICGFASRFHILNQKTKKFILVDHNELNQSIEGIESAEILEIIDHHRIGRLGTDKPIYFRNEIIGSTSSIIFKIYEENSVELDKDIASLLLAGIISDTLNLRSPTTTEEDRQIATKLSVITGLDVDVYAKDIFSASDSIKDKCFDKIITQDIKSFTMSDYTVMISQVIVFDLSEVVEIIEDLTVFMVEYVKNERFDLLVVCFTSIVENGSIILNEGILRTDAINIFSDLEQELSGFFPNLVSRKKQIVPKVQSYIESLNR